MTTTDNKSTFPTTEQTNPENNRILTNMMGLRKTMADVLKLLLSPGQEMIDKALMLVLHFFDVDRVYIGIFNDQELTVDFTHEVTYASVVSLREDLLRQLSSSDIPWWINKIKHGEDIVVYDVAQMPEEASREQHLLQLQDVHSLLALPAFRSGKVSGFIGLDAVRSHRLWSIIDIENLRMLADIVSIAIDRGRAQTLMERSFKEVVKSEAKFQMIFEKLPWGVELYDKEGNLLDINEADMNIFGISHEASLGINMFTNPNIPDYVNKKLRNGEDVTFSINYNFKTVSETSYYNSDIKEDIKHLQVKGVALKDEAHAIFGYLYIVFDDTENHTKTEQTEQALMRLKVAVDTGQSIMWEYDVETDRLVIDYSLNEDLEHNEQLAFIKEFDIMNLKKFIETLHPEDRDNVFEKNFKRLLNGEIDNYIVTYRRILNDKLYWFNSNVRSFKFKADGKPSKIVSYTSNITKQRESEIELIKVKEADELKSAFLASMSHEIRTPLNAIVGFSNIIAETENGDEKELYLDIIHKNNDLLLQLVNDILDFSKIESGMQAYSIAPADIKTICEEVYYSNHLLKSANLQLVFDKNLPSVPLHTDSRRITQVISNFVNNAVKFTERGSITIGYETKGNQVRVYVKDTGIGISPAYQARVFERFIKLNEFKQGTGLGLTICKIIIENLGGSIGVDSVAGEGSTFWFTLPLSCH